MCETLTPTTYWAARREMMSYTQHVTADTLFVVLPYLDDPEIREEYDRLTAVYASQCAHTKLPRLFRKKRLLKRLYRTHPASRIFGVGNARHMRRVMRVYDPMMVDSSGAHF